MNNILRTSAILILACLSWTVQAQQQATKAFGMNIAAADSESLRRALDSAFAGENAGLIPGPFNTEWTLGHITLRNISYQFNTRISNLAFTDNGLAVQAMIRGFKGSLGRLEFNDAGTSYCSDVQIASHGKDILVNLILHAAVNNEGNIDLAVKSSDVQLNAENFQIEQPSICDVAPGFNWLVRWIVPSVMARYRSVISERMRGSIAEGLREMGLAVSPYLALNLTLPVNDRRLQPFYAKLAVSPTEIKIDRRHFAAWFGAQIEFDPDLDSSTSSFSEPELWPINTSHVRVSWDFMNAMMAEANNKGLVSGVFSANRGADPWYDSKVWNAVWPKWSERPGSPERVKYRLEGSESLIWEVLGDQDKQALLKIKDLRFEILDPKNRIIALLHLDMELAVAITLAKNDAKSVQAAVVDVRFSRAIVDDQIGQLAGEEWQSEGLLKITDELRASVARMSWQHRTFLDIETPPLSLGTYQFSLLNAKFNQQGILLPFRFTAK